MTEYLSIYVNTLIYVQRTLLNIGNPERTLRETAACATVSFSHPLPPHASNKYMSPMWKRKSTLFQIIFLLLPLPSSLSTEQIYSSTPCSFFAFNRSVLALLLPSSLSQIRSSRSNTPFQLLFLSIFNSFSSTPTLTPTPFILFTPAATRFVPVVLLSLDLLVFLVETFLQEIALVKGCEHAYWFVLIKSLIFLLCYSGWNLCITNSVIMPYLPVKITY